MALKASTMLGVIPLCSECEDGLREHMRRNNLGAVEALNSCLLVGLDFMDSPVFGQLLLDFFAEHDDFDWPSFMEFCGARFALVG